MNKLVSIIIPSYNNAEFIADALESVFNQTYSNFEILIVDDGSTDDTKALLAKYAASYPKKIRCSYIENSGAGTARNIGLKQAKGEYVAYLDADDVWLPHKLETQLTVFEERPEVDLIFSNSHLVDSKGASLNKLYVKPFEFNFRPEQLFERLLTERDFIPFSSIILKRSIIDDIGLFDESLRSSGDLEWLLRIVRKYKAIGINDVLAKYRIHDTAISKNIILREQSRIKIIKDCMTKYPNETGSLTKRLRARISKCYYEWGYVEFERNNLKIARKKFLESTQYNPLIKLQKYFYILASFIPVRCVSSLKTIKRRFFKLT